MKLQYKNISVETVLPELIHENKVVGYFAGRAEIGPRALCHRSIFANPTIKENLNRVNKIKNREFWRPLAPVIKEEAFHEIVELKHLSPFMLIAAPVKEEWKSRIPAVTHVDGTCRPQSINSKQNEVIHQALVNFEKLSGVPVFMNTSFNLRGEPLVDSPQDALKTFWNSDLDCLIMEDFLVEKTEKDGSAQDPPKDDCEKPFMERSLKHYKEASSANPEFYTAPLKAG